MTPETVEALKKSIKHWQDNVMAETPDKASTNASDCALCNMFANGVFGCEGCPIALHTEEDHCEETPYYEANHALEAWEDEPNNEEHRDAFRKAAQEELDFLVSLLPEEKDNTPGMLWIDQGCQIK